jgi:hypothetical protein
MSSVGNKPVALWGDMYLRLLKHITSTNPYFMLWTEDRVIAKLPSNKSRDLITSRALKNILPLISKHKRGLLGQIKLESLLYVELQSPREVANQRWRVLRTKSEDCGNRYGEVMILLHDLYKSLHDR